MGEIILFTYLFLLFLIIFSSGISAKTKNYTNEINSLKNRLHAEQEYTKKLSKQLNSLEKYSDIIDAKEEAARIKLKATEKLTKAEEYLTDIIKYHKEQTNLIHNELQHKINNLDTQLKNAIQTIEESKHLENFVKGYSNYFISDFSVFDELIEKYGFADGAKQLQIARKRTQILIENNEAVTSGYLNVFTSNIIKSFLLEAFNTKIENLYQTIKKTTYPIIEKQIIDYFTSINQIGNFLSQTQITESYLASKLEEIKWTYRINEFIEKKKIADAAKREELKDMLKAKKEQDKAILKIHNAILNRQEHLTQLDEKIKNLDDSSPEKIKLIKERSIISNEIKDLQGKQEKTKSMAELGFKAGVVYIISNIGSFGENIFKIGMTRRYDVEECIFAPQKRIDELFSASIPFPFDVHAFIETEDAIKLEKALHDKLVLQRVNKVNHFKEFFNISSTDIYNSVNEVLNNLGITKEIHWTLEAQMAQWKETQIINNKIKNDEQYKAKFIADWTKITPIEEENFEL